MKDETRHSTFSSSKIWKLITNDKKGGIGKPGLTYIKQVNYEHILGRSIDTETTGRAASWGTLVERRAFDLVDTSYSLVSGQRLFHPDFPFWSGAPDLLFENGCADIKCPFSLEVFCDKLGALKDISKYKEEFPEDYWQHVSNAILLEKNGHPVTYAEAIIYVPYQSELSEIRDLASNFDGDQNKVAWVQFAHDDDLPYLIQGKGYENLNIIRFDVSQEDKDALTARVKEAGKLLQPETSLA